MFRRKITERLIQWKNDPRKVPLVIKGLRQVGKTSIVRDFAIHHYENAFFLDFRRDISLHRLFEGDFDMERLTASITALPSSARLIEGSRMIPNKTVLVFDEIQDCPNARSSLRYFKEDGRFDVICTGSMLGVSGFRSTEKASRGIPVGSEEQIVMYPMDFEEFLWAVGVDEAVFDQAKRSYDSRAEIPSYVHQRLLEYVRSYIVIGGMPEVVACYVETNDYSVTRRIQKRILTDYQSDFGIHLNDKLEWHVDETERLRILQVFSSIPKQFAKDNHKFQYSAIGHGARARTHEPAIAWLKSYGLVEQCYNLSALEKPLDLFADESNFKVYLADIGLLMAMLDDDAALGVLTDSLGIGKGPIYENLVSEAFHKLGKAQYFFSKASGVEIDFVATLNGVVHLVEVKATSGRTKAARTLLDDDSNPVNALLKLTSQNISFADDVATVPYYLSCYVLSK